MITVSVDVDPIIKYFNDIGRGEQVGFAVSKGLNRLADRVQQRVRDRIESAFKIKRKQFLFNSIKILKTNRATKTSWAVRIEVTYQALADMETGTPHTPGNGRSLLAAQAGKLTDRIIRGSNALAMRNLTFGSSTIQPHQTGGNRTFSMNTSKGLLILQRTSRKNTKILYRMVSRINRPMKLHFTDTATRVISTEYQDVFSQAIQDVFTSMRAKR